MKELTSKTQVNHKAQADMFLSQFVDSISKTHFLGGLLYKGESVNFCWNGPNSKCLRYCRLRSLLNLADAA